MVYICTYFGWDRTSSNTVFFNIFEINIVRVELKWDKEGIVGITLQIKGFTYIDEYNLNIIILKQNHNLKKISIEDKDFLAMIFTDKELDEANIMIEKEKPCAR